MAHESCCPQERQLGLAWLARPQFPSYLNLPADPAYLQKEKFMKSANLFKNVAFAIAGTVALGALLLEAFMIATGKMTMDLAVDVILAAMGAAVVALVGHLVHETAERRLTPMTQADYMRLATKLQAIAIAIAAILAFGSLLYLATSIVSGTTSVFGAMCVLLIVTSAAVIALIGCYAPELVRHLTVRMTTTSAPQPHRV
ncbi:hypothetical protein [Paraburkholderia youngii]|uniref:hypothetical protein n=1 Tax=Paraburkholderia youngii TaxID=2782701 RepID=UPI003D1CB3AE